MRSLVVPACIGLFVVCHADEQPLKAVRVTTPPTIDGIIGDDEWKGVPFVEGLHDFNTGASYADSGRFWLAYDRNFVYFAARLKESEPRAIHATEYRTNVALTGDDYVELDLDLSGSLSAMNKFQINPQGATNIAIAGGRAAKREWLGEFVAKGRIVDGGWECEARIPWRAMDIPKGGKRNVRFNILRFVAKSQRQFSYVFVPQTQTGLTPTWVGVDLPKPEVDRGIKLLPYGYAGYDPKTGGVFNAGIDMKTALTDQINLVGSINPDFRNIENQILSIDFSRFERLAGETRPFFEEGMQYSDSQIFASQRIRSFDVGLNTYGRIDDRTSFSLIDTDRFGKESATVLNVTHDPTPNDSIRVTATDLEQPGLRNQAYLLRYSKNIGPLNLFLRDMGSNDAALGFGRQDDVVASYVKGGLGLTGGWTWAQRAFDPKLGFIQEVDLTGPVAEVDYSRNYDRGNLSNWSMSLFGVNFDHLDGSFYRNEYSASANVTLRQGVFLLAAADVGDFEGSHDSLYSLGASFPRGNPYRQIAVHFDSGRQAGIPYRNATVAGAYRFSNKLQLTLRHQHVDYAGPSDQTIFSLNYDLGRDRAISGRMVRQNGETNAYLAYQRSGNRGMEYFLILGDPNARTFRSSLILKVVMPLRIGKSAVERGASTISSIH